MSWSSSLGQHKRMKTCQKVPQYKQYAHRPQMTDYCNRSAPTQLNIFQQLVFKKGIRDFQKTKSAEEIVNSRPVESANCIFGILWVFILNERKARRISCYPDTLQATIVTKRSLNFLLLRFFRQVTDIHFALCACVAISTCHYDNSSTARPLIKTATI